MATSPQEHAFPAAPAAIGRGLISTPFQFAFTGEDRLEMTVISLRGAVTVGFGLRVLNDGAPVHAFQEQHTTPAVATWETKYYQVGKGFVLNAIAYIVSGAPLRGQCWVRLRIVRGYNDRPTPLGTLLQGYITARKDLAFPGSPLEIPADGQGAFTFNPPPVALAFGQEWSVTVPQYARWRLLTASLTLTTGALPGTRVPSLIVQDSGGLTIFRSVMPASYGVGVAALLTWAVGMPLAVEVQPGWAVAGIMDSLNLGPGCVIRTITPGLNASDLLSGFAFVEEWVNGD